jgi:hypothetical protein
MSDTARPNSSQRQPDARARARRRRLRWYLLFLAQFAAIAWPPLYNKTEPAIAGIPFFYWYQLLWIVIGGVLTAIVYFATEKSRREPGTIETPPVA